ncbi:ABC-type dipeptide/oligopeptide/nickel transport system permease component [Bradyrhizobium ottawaense]
MFAYLVRRLFLMLVTLFGISIVIFLLLRIVPGNIVDILFAAAGYVDPADKANLEKELGIDQPLIVQYWHWISGFLRGDFGYSYVSEKPALQEILPRIPITARLAGLALLFSVSIGIPLGVISAVKQGTRLDYALRVVSLSGLSLPSFWLGLLILTASVAMFGQMPIFNPNPQTWLEAFATYAVPAAAVGFRSAALTMRITRSSMLEVLRQDYIRTARAKGALRCRRELSARAEERDPARHHRDRHRGGVPDRRPDRHRDGVQHPRRRPLPGRGDPLARLSDRAEPRDADRRRGGEREFHRRHALRRVRSAHQVHGLAA